MKTNNFVEIIKEALVGKELFYNDRTRGVITDVSLTKDENHISIETDHLSSHCYRYWFSEEISTISKKEAEAVMQNNRQEKIERICNHITNGNFEYSPYNNTNRFIVDGKIKMSIMPAGRDNDLDYGFYVKESNNYAYNFFTEDEVKKIRDSFVTYAVNKNKTIVENAFNELDI